MLLLLLRASAISTLTNFIFPRVTLPSGGAKLLAVNELVLYVTFLHGGGARQSCPSGELETPSKTLPSDVFGYPTPLPGGVSPFLSVSQVTGYLLPYV